MQELCGRGQGSELRLEFLTAADVAAYAAGRRGGPVADPLTAFLYARTDGNDWFMVTIVEHLVQQGVVVRRAGQWTLQENTEALRAGLPEGLRELLLRRIEALAPEARRVLEAASVVGETFAAAAEAGVTVVTEALTRVAATEERWWEAEVPRLRGALILQLRLPDVGQAEVRFQQALDVARRQQAKALELRATLSLSRLWQQQGKREAARQVLAPVYGWFTEGLDTVDLQEAKALLEALRG